MRRFAFREKNGMANEFQQRGQELIEAGQVLYERGMVPATSGNLSARLSDGSIAITVSGRHKGRLKPEDIMRVDAEGKSLDDRKPSAETLLHTQVYRRIPDAGAVLHPHSVNATLLSRRHACAPVVLQNYELLKALPGIATHASKIQVPVFGNDQNIERLAREVDAYMVSHEPVYGYLIGSHGFYTWGPTVDDALNRVEAFEFLFECEIRGGKP
jgi:methylthioribulose-1-phosphate dehydratase